MDQHTLAAHIDQAAERILFVLPPRSVNNHTTAEAGTVMQAARLGLEQAIANARQRTAHPDRYTYSDITPFNYQTPTPTYIRITQAIARAGRANRFAGRTDTNRINLFTHGDRVRVTGPEDELETYGAEDVAGMTGTIDRPYENIEGVLDTAAWYVQIDGDGEWYIQANHLELLP